MKQAKLTPLKIQVKTYSVKEVADLYSVNVENATPQP